MMLSSIPFFAPLKKIATILLLIFTMVQAAPAIKLLVKGESVSLFNPDEEKNSGEKSGKLKDGHKQVSDLLIAQSADISLTSLSKWRFMSGETLPVHPCTDKLTPPPNFC